MYSGDDNYFILSIIHLNVDFLSHFNTTVLNMLQKSGARLVGKTNCDEFGMG